MSIRIHPSSIAVEDRVVLKGDGPRVVGTVVHVYGLDWANMTDEDYRIEWDDGAVTAEAARDVRRS
jgi:hypothetical protein